MDLIRTTRLLFPFILSFSLVACGGGGFTGDESGTTTSSAGTGGTSSNPNTGGSTTTDTSGSSTTVNELRLSTSSFQLQSASSNAIVLSAIAKNQNNVLLSDADIQISVDGSADLTATTGATVRTATLTPGIPDNRVLTVTATVGDKTETLQIEVVGTTVSLSGPESITLNKQSDYKVIVKDSADNPIGNKSISIPTVTGPCNLVTTQAPNLSSAGEYSFSLVGTSEGTCSLSTDNFGASASLDIGVSGDEFTITSSTDKTNDVLNGDANILEVPVGADETINLLLKKNNLVVTGKTIQLSTTRGLLRSSGGAVISSVTTDVNGEASFNVNSTNTGDAVITASVDGLKAILKDVEFVSDAPVYITTQASPSIVKPLAKSTITTTIHDINNNPVKNKIITFRIETGGGSLNTSEAKTDSLGRASIEYTAGTDASATDGVVIATEVQGNTTLNKNVSLTVGGNALRIVLGTNSTLETSNLTYTKKFIAIVTDSAGNPVKDQNISFSLIPTAFYKGRMVGVDTDNDGIADAWSDATAQLPISAAPVYSSAITKCISEDANNNGNPDQGEDIDGDNQLEPTHDATVTGANVTDENGAVVLSVTYPKSRALWSEQQLIVGTTVGGSEYQETSTFRLGIASSDIDDITIAAPNEISPYGLYADCSIPQ